MALTDAVADHPLFFQPGLSTTADWFRLAWSRYVAAPRLKAKIMALAGRK